MLFATASLARRIEQAEVSLVADIWRAVARRVRDDSVYLQNIGGGAAVLAGPTSPLSKLVGLGFEPIDEDLLGAIEGQFARRKTAVRAEVATLADPAIGSQLTRRGYVLSGFENVLGLPLDRPSIPMSESGSPSVSRASTIAVARTTADQAGRWADVISTGFLHPDSFDGPPSEEVVDRQAIDQVFRDISEVEGLVRYLATREGEFAGGASMRILNGVAQLCGAATLPEHRRRGVQTALLRERLAEAAREGCDVAVVTTQPGSPSQENAQRQGFELLYARAVLIKPV
jgi:GNAT superfamily N-acetyltransferase